MDHVLCGLAANTALPSDLVDRLIGIADDDLAAELATRADLGRTQEEAVGAEDQDGIVRLGTLFGALVLARAPKGFPISEEILAAARALTAAD
ncbi:hypothetical protein [Streptomyces viridosporus]|uniref:hypothetical protein n=1 Tax=Streptomyces viridosporus TaxID=67581 RepID=UPI0036FE888B